MRMSKYQQDKIFADRALEILTDIALLHANSRSETSLMCGVCNTLWPCQTYRYATGGGSCER